MATASSTRKQTRPRSALAEYRRKRDFTKTAEPPDRAGRRHRQPIFVIQEHHARRLHYDFRLEADGVLKSWAVTKVPSLSPALRRLAVRTEDHPLAYAEFEGQIPAGQYGAGQVIRWDHGTYENLSGRPLSEALERGKAEVLLHGSRLQGKFALVRMRGEERHENWLLIKARDEYAREAEEPESTERPRSADILSAVSQVSNLQAGRGSQRSRQKKRLQTGSPRYSRLETRATGLRRAASVQAASKSSGATSVRRRAEDRAPYREAPSSETPAPPFQFTHLDKVLFPEPGYTKGDLLRYYAAVARLLLPHLRDRPMTLERLPEGVRPDAPRFWQKNTPAYYPEWIPRVTLPGPTGDVHYPLVNDEVALLYLANQGTLTFHPWLSHTGSLDHPDFVLFDLDPGETRFTDLITIAKALHKELEAQDVESFVKTSGKSGLHVLVPWRRHGGYDEARAWALSVAQRLTAKLPDLATTERRKDARRGRAYVDVMQNARGRHVVPPYVVRAVPAATVSTPLQWRELTPRLRPAQFDLKSALRRFERQGEDLMKPLAAPGA